MAREVNITLRGVLEDLPEEVVEFLTITGKKLGSAEEELGEVVSRLINEEEISHCLVDLGKIREGLYKVDNRIQDCMQILNAYQKVLSNPEAMSSPPTSASPEEGGSVEE